MKQFHKLTVGTDKDEDTAVLHFALHPLMDYTAQRTDSLVHICPPGHRKQRIVSFRLNMAASKTLGKEFHQYFLSPVPEVGTKPIVKQHGSPCGTGSSRKYSVAADLN